MIKRHLPSSGAVFNHLIDYAGLFPPAGLGMREAVRSYATYSIGRDAALLGRFIVPASRLGEFAEAAIGAAVEGMETWSLSVLLAENLAADIAKATDFAEVCRRTKSLCVSIDCVEMKISSVGELQSVAKAIPPNWMAYYEVPFGSHSAHTIDAVANAGGRTKMRTGGVTADGFPQAAEISQFIGTCWKKKVRFKATAGLHHAVRSVHPFTYEEDSPSGWMHGFLNLLLASAFTQIGSDPDEAAEVLSETDATSFRFGEHEVCWKHKSISYKELGRTRNTLFTSFGSCSFTEPTTELRELEIL